MTLYVHVPPPPLTNITFGKENCQFAENGNVLQFVSPISNKENLLSMSRYILKVGKMERWKEKEREREREGKREREKEREREREREKKKRERERERERKRERGRRASVGTSAADEVLRFS